MRLDTSWALLVDQVVTGSLWTGIGGGSESDWIPDPSPPSDPGGVVFADSSSKSSSLMGGIIGFAFCFIGGWVEDGGGASRRGYEGGGTTLGAGRTNGCGGGPCAGSKVLNVVAGWRDRRRYGHSYVTPCHWYNNS